MNAMSSRMVSGIARRGDGLHHDNMADWYCRTSLQHHLRRLPVPAETCRTAVGLHRRMTSSASLEVHNLSKPTTSQI